ncbi:Sodium- and chloride-dependent GABA transporter 3 [Acropora cervicornis]|uniref:Sodium- and chloride-dependent GABA transporter 3 n=1 Tax=Acropora cervicornis TaxID=6130 RepID=A0AAD9UU04_ACRCE|nr:Sodium- and chloride-dependent GABA transporter 3 [Acropora cervicornis]
MPVAPLWSILFFFMVILLGLDSENEFVGVEGFVTAIVDLFPYQLRRGHRKELFIALCSVIWYLIGLSMVMEGGMYVFQLFDSYSASGSALLWVSVFQSIAIGWVYGGDRFYDNMTSMFGFRINPWIKWCWKYCAPLFCMGIFIFSLATYKPLKYNNYKYPAWGEAIGWCMALSSILCIPGYMIFRFLTTSGSLREVCALKHCHDRIKSFSFGFDLSSYNFWMEIAPLQLQPDYDCIQALLLPIDWMKPGSTLKKLLFKLI